MSLISRLTTWVSGQILKSADLNGEYNNIVNTMNNLDSATTAWTNVKGATFTVTGNETVAGTLAITGITTVTGGILGTATNNNATAGNVGEYFSSTISVFTNAPTTGQYGDLTSIPLTAGDWDVSAGIDWTRNGATWTDAWIGISTTTGNSATGLTQGDNLFANGWASTTSAVTDQCLWIPAWRLSIASPTTVYLKYRAGYSLNGPPQATGRISARRVR